MAEHRSLHTETQSQSDILTAQVLENVHKPESLADFFTKFSRFLKKGHATCQILDFKDLSVFIKNLQKLTEGRCDASER